MANAAYWFKHDTNAKDDYKIMLLIDQLGLEGYGIFWILIETLREQEGYRYPMVMLPILAKRYNTSGEKMKTVVMQYGLFEILDDDTFLSPALARRMGAYDKLVEQKRLSGSKGGKSRADKREADAKQDSGTDEADAKQTPDASQADAKQEDSTDEADAKQTPSISQADAKQMLGCNEADAKQSPSTTQAIGLDRSGLDRKGEEKTRPDKRGVRGENVGRSGKEVYDTVGKHSIQYSTIQTFLSQGYTQAEIDDVIDGLRIYQGLGEIKSIGPFMASWLRKRRENPRPVPGTRVEGIPCRLYSVQEVDKLQLWKDASIVRIEGRSACQSADGKVLLALNSDIERLGLTKREPKPVGADWPD